MAKFMVKASYTAEGTKGLLKEGGSGRKALVEKVIKGLGSMEAFYFAFGEADVFIICDLPDSTTAAALSLAVNVTGTVDLSMIPLLTVDAIDQACKKSVAYRGPGA